MSEHAADQRPKRVAIAVAALAFLGILLLPAFFATPDEAKYIGLGLNILDGRGLVTDFGAQFLNHSPLWPLVLAAPQRLLGVDALAVGHVLNAISGAAIVALTGALAWRVRPIAGVLAAVATLAFPYLTEISRTASMDVPAAALTLGFTWTALRALDRRSVGLGLLAGCLFGLGFLVKETTLPFLPAPFLVALLGAVPAVAVARVGAAALASAALVTSWWFALHAILGGTVYRLGTPGWTLAPIGILVLVLVVLGFGAQHIASRPAVAARLATVRPAVAARWRPVTAWTGLGLWVVGQLFVYGRTAKLAGQSLFRPAQYLADAREFGPQLAVGISFGLVGAVLALWLVRRSQGARELLFAFIAGVPLLVLVLAIGETPRHYLANLAVLLGLAAGGWVYAFERARSTRRGLGGFIVAALIAVGIAFAASQPSTRQTILVAYTVAVIGGLGALAWVLSRPAVRRATAGARSRWPVAVSAGTAALVVLLIGGGLVFAVSGVSRSVAAERARVEAIATIDTWVEANVPAGQAVATSSALAYETAVRVRGSHPVVRIQPGVALVDGDAPLGLRWRTGAPVTDPVRVGTLLRNVDQLGVFSAATLGERLRDQRPVVWIDASYLAPGEETTPTGAMLDGAEGIEAVQTWSFPINSASTLVVVAYAIDPDSVAFDPSRVFTDAETLTAIARLMDDAGARSAAAALADRVVLAPDTPEGRDALAVLRAVGAGGVEEDATPRP